MSTVGARSTGRRVSVGALMAALLAACVAFQLNASMLSPALASIEEELGATAAEVGLTQTAFFTSAALFSLFLPRLGDLVGRKRVLACMVGLMTVGCVIAALAPNIPVLFVGRVVQGVSGPVVPLCLIMLRHEVREPKRYGTLMGVVTAVNGGVAGVDALAGGYLAEQYGFHSVFWAMAAVAVVATVLVPLLAPESRAQATGRMDWLGVALPRRLGRRDAHRAERGRQAGRGQLAADRDPGARLGRDVRGLLAGRGPRLASPGRDQAPPPAGDLGAAADDRAHHDRCVRRDERAAALARAGRAGQSRPERRASLLGGR